MRKVTREEALQLGIKTQTWKRVQCLPEGHYRRVALARAVEILRSVTELEKKYGPIRLS